jgi:hypothetical protein
MSRTPPANLRSLEARVRNLARSIELPEGRVRRFVALTVVTHLLAESNLAIVKGATNLEIRLGTAATRVSNDLDTVRRIGLVEFRQQLIDQLRVGWGGFTGLLVDRGEIAAPVPEAYRPHRFHVKLAFNSQPYATVELEVAAEEVGALTSTDSIVSIDAVAWFDDLGLPSPLAAPALKLSHQIAQKLHACTTPDADDWVNDRSHDLVDLQLALDVFDGSLKEISDVAQRLFAARRRHSWPPVVTARQGWGDQYRLQAAGLPVATDLDEALAWVNDLIDRISRSER